MILLDEIGVRYRFSLFIIVTLLYALLFYSYLTLTFLIILTQFCPPKDVIVYSAATNGKGIKTT